MIGLQARCAFQAEILSGLEGINPKVCSALGLDIKVNKNPFI
jgi:hypothetical protein